MNLARTKLEAALSRKGFSSSEGKSHTKWMLHVGGKRTSVVLMLSRGTDYKDLRNQILGMIRKEMKLSGEQFQRFVDCPMSQDEYLGILRAQGIVPPE